MDKYALNTKGQGMITIFPRILNDTIKELTDLKYIITKIREQTITQDHIDGYRNIILTGYNIYFEKTEESKMKEIRREACPKYMVLETIKEILDADNTVLLIKPVFRDGKKTDYEIHWEFEKK